MSTLHDRIRSEVERRLAIARAAEEWHPSPWRYQIATLRLDAMVDGRGGYVFMFAHHYGTSSLCCLATRPPARSADAIRRYEYALNVLDRSDLLDLATSLGLETTDG